MEPACSTSSFSPPLPPLPSELLSSCSPRLDDIRTTFHPSTGRAPIIQGFEEFRKESVLPPRRPPAQPWLPFRSESEFGFAKIVHQAGMSAEGIDGLIKIINRLLGDREEYFLLKSNKDLKEMWERATEKYAPYEKTSLTVCSGKYIRTFEFISRPLKQWITNVLGDPYIGKLARFDSVCLEKFDGEKWVRFYDAPWTRKRMWDVQ
ncbi:hypothetical protein H0H92_013231, partial [Tricholoma furcatifolium]